MEITELQGSTMLRDAPSIINKNNEEIAKELAGKVNKVLPVDNDMNYVCGGKNGDSGALLRLHGKDHESKGSFALDATDGTNKKTLSGGADGALWWNNKLVTTDDKLANKENITMPNNTSSNEIDGGTEFNNGASIVLNGKDNDVVNIGQKGYFLLHAKDDSGGANMFGLPNGDLYWADGNLGGSTIVSQGDNYIRYASGLQMCWGIDFVTSSSKYTWTFPKPFSQQPTVMWQANGCDTSLLDVAGGSGVSLTSATFIPFRNSGGSFAPYGVNGFAMGRWK